MDSTVDIPLRMTNKAMLESFIGQMMICAVFIGINGRTFLNRCTNDFVNWFQPSLRNGMRAYLTAFLMALQKAEDCLLARATAAIFTLAGRLVHVASKATDICFIN